MFTDEESQVRFTLVAPDGTVLAISGPYPDKRHAAAAIKDVRECAGTGLIKDLCPASARHAASGDGGKNAAPHCLVPNWGQSVTRPGRR